MKKINLRDYYPDYYTTDCIIEVPDEVAALMDAYEHAEAAYYLRRYRHKAYYSLDRGNGVSRMTSCLYPYLPAKYTSVRKSSRFAGMFTTLCARKCVSSNRRGRGM